MAELSERHLSALLTLRNKKTSPFQKSEVSTLMNRGLVEPATARGAYGMTHYRLTTAGHQHAENLVLNQGRVVHDPAAAAQARQTALAAQPPSDPNAKPVLHVHELKGLSLEEKRQRTTEFQAATKKWREANPEG